MERGEQQALRVLRAQTCPASGAGVDHARMVLRTGIREAASVAIKWFPDTWDSRSTSFGVPAQISVRQRSPSASCHSKCREEQSCAHTPTSCTDRHRTYPREYQLYMKHNYDATRVVSRVAQPCPAQTGRRFARESEVKQAKGRGRAAHLARLGCTIGHGFPIPPPGRPTVVILL